MNSAMCMHDIQQCVIRTKIDHSPLKNILPLNKVNTDLIVISTLHSHPHNNLNLASAASCVSTIIVHHSLIKIHSTSA